ncbi:type IV toxin-antitoxin system AbiEi family antitoxin domain-containing protein [Hyphomicrobium sp.]|uniref:type IV toxin-antitoxin system AbiEi family antitoxin domain-containing protein n=1 Tax=Hyphomicrobium sp. TaxID=82 RepID=UPI0025BE4D75|nr:type IV toxin-antitoxin system AbiEi family antitoxin domain-containing protein [Hyphomicrobium sp.]MCC7250439.1 type IV toxin-antitoxin system AbiEi family antitoxin [Hyphomicrobium sp.]
MAKQKRSSLNRLEQELPEGLLVDAAWLAAKGYSTALRSQYVAGDWLHQPARRVYQRRSAPLTWQQVVVSLQTLLGYDLVLGGRSALELQGYAHYLRQRGTTLYLYGSRKPPTWLNTLPLPDVRFIYRNATALFPAAQMPAGPQKLEARKDLDKSDSFVVQPWGQYDWPLVLSTPERAVLELLDELPDHESFHNVDMLMQGLTTLRPAKLHRLLAECKSVKVKRLFFFFADRHSHAWLGRIDRKAVDLGAGKRMLVKGGRLDSQYQITVPKDF